MPATAPTMVVILLMDGLLLSSAESKESLVDDMVAELPVRVLCQK